MKEEEERVANNSETDDLLTVWNEEASQVKNRLIRSRQLPNTKCKPTISTAATSASAHRRSAASNSKSHNNSSSFSARSKVVADVTPVKRSYRNRPNLNYAKIGQGMDESKKSPQASLRRSGRSPVKAPLSIAKIASGRIERRSRRSSTNG